MAHRCDPCRPRVGDHIRGRPGDGGPPAQVALSDGGVPQAKEIRGKIKALDRAKKSVTLEDGTTLTIPKAVKVTPTALQKGAMVTANYEVQDGQKVIISLEVWQLPKF